jgi:hypothetical protein
MKTATKLKTKTKLKGKAKPEFKALSSMVTSRFMEVIGEIMMVNKRTGGPYRNYREMADSINCSYTVFSQYTDLSRNVTLEMCCSLCIVHGINGHWLLTGKGDKKQGDKSNGDGVALTKIERRLMEIEKRLAPKPGRR